MIKINDMLSGPLGEKDEMKKIMLMWEHHILMFDDIFFQIINMNRCVIVEINTTTINDRYGVFSIHITKLG
jgi:hypothetical protein